MAYEFGGDLDYLLRRKTTTIQKDPEHLIDKIVSYVIHVRVAQKFPYKPANIIAMDETAVWANMVAGTTVEKTERKKLLLKVLVTRKCG